MFAKQTIAVGLKRDYFATLVMTVGVCSNKTEAQLVIARRATARRSNLIQTPAIIFRKAKTSFATQHYFTASKQQKYTTYKNIVFNALFIKTISKVFFCEKLLKKIKN